MESQILTLKPNKFFVGKYFEEVKANLKKVNENTEDFGTALYLNYPNYFMVVDEMYTLEVYYTETLNDVNQKISLIESIIRDRISNFRFDKSNMEFSN